MYKAGRELLSLIPHPKQPHSPLPLYAPRSSSSTEVPYCLSWIEDLMQDRKGLAKQNDKEEDILPKSRLQ